MEIVTTKKYQIFNSNIIKIIAIIAMTIDHITWAVYPGYPDQLLPIILHLIGRITCPIMCYFIAEGFHYTRNKLKYACRLFIFAFISHFAYVYASNDYIDIKSFIPFYYGSFINQTSVLWSLAFGLIMLIIYYNEKLSNFVKVILIILCSVIAFPSDWSSIASLMVFVIGTNRGNYKKQFLWMMFYVAIYAIVYFFAVDRLFAFLQLGICLSFPLILLYNGQRGKNKKINQLMKWFFYLYYPLHLLIIGIIYRY